MSQKEYSPSTLHCIARKFGRELNLAVWQSAYATAKLKSTDTVIIVIFGSTAKFNSLQYFSYMVCILRVEFGDFPLSSHKCMQPPFVAYYVTKLRCLLIFAHINYLQVSTLHRRILEEHFLSHEYSRNVLSALLLISVHLYCIAKALQPAGHSLSIALMIFSHYHFTTLVSSLVCNSIRVLPRIK